MWKEDKQLKIKFWPKYEMRFVKEVQLSQSIFKQDLDKNFVRDKTLTVVSWSCDSYVVIGRR